MNEQARIAVRAANMEPQIGQRMARAYVRNNGVPLRLFILARFLKRGWLKNEHRQTTLPKGQ